MAATATVTDGMNHTIPDTSHEITDEELRWTIRLWRKLEFKEKRILEQIQWDLAQSGFGGRTNFRMRACMHEAMRVWVLTQSPSSCRERKIHGPAA